MACCRIMIAAIVLTLLALHVPSLGQDAAGGYRFFINGEASDDFDWAPVFGTLDAPAAGDLFFTPDRELAFFLGDPGDYRFVRPKSGRDKVIYIDDGSSRRPVAAFVFTDYDTDEVVNPLSGMADSELRELRSLNIEAWNEDVASAISRMDGGNLCVTVDIAETTNREGHTGLPALPENLKCLIIDQGSSSSAETYDLSELAGLRGLEYFQFHAMTNEAFDLKLIERNTELKMLLVNNFDGVRNLEVLSGFHEMRFLNLSWTPGVGDISFVGQMPHLRFLDMDLTGVSDLSPLSNHGAIVYVSVSMSNADTLPGGALDTLTELHIMKTRIPEAEAAAFAAAHPRCHVYHGYASSLKKALQGADRLLMRKRFKCEMDGDILFEETSPSAVAEFVDHIEIDEEQSGGNCACCGYPLLMFYKGENLLAAMSLHHGRALRWNNWDGDGVLTRSSSGYITNWLAQRGITGPREENEYEQGLADAEMLINQKYASLVPEEVLMRLTDAEQEPVDVLSVFNEIIPDENERAALFLRLLGCHNGSWNLLYPMDEFLLMQAMPSLQADAVINAIIKNPGDTMIKNGAARWLLHENGDGVPDSEQLKSILPDLVQWALGHPRQISRRCAMLDLEKIGGSFAIERLRRVMRGEIPARELSSEEKEMREEPARTTISGACELDIFCKDCSDRAFAAYLLARLGDKDSLKEILSLLQSASHEDRPVLNNAVDILKR